MKVKDDDAPSYDAPQASLISHLIVQLRTDLLLLCAEVIVGISSEDLKGALEGLTINASCRHGKYFWLEFGPGSSSLLLHFGEGLSIHA